MKDKSFRAGMQTVHHHHRIMDAPAHTTMMLASPSKRKRSDSLAADTQHSPARFITELPSRSLPVSGLEPESPRAVVSRQFKTLRIDTKGLPEKLPRGFDVTLTSNSRPFRNVSELTRDSPTGRTTYYAENNILPFDFTQGVPVFRQTEKTSGKSHAPTAPAMSSIERPVTPTLLPMPSPDAGPIISPFPSAPVTPPGLGQAALTESSPTSATPTTPTLQMPSGMDPFLSAPLESRIFLRPGSPARIAPASKRVQKPRRRRESPPPNTPNENSSLVWSDKDITGHDPDDPNDDGYGINGIGFKPTPAIAERRRMQRKKQVNNWRRREDMEKRARRREARQGGKLEPETKSDEEQNRKVRFAEVH